MFRWKQITVERILFWPRPDPLAGATSSQPKEKAKPRKTPSGNMIQIEKAKPRKTTPGNLIQIEKAKPRKTPPGNLIQIPQMV